MKSDLPEGSYVNADGQPVVVLNRPDQPQDDSQVKGIVQQGSISWIIR